MKRILVAFLCLFATSAFAIGLGNDNIAAGGSATAVQGQTQGQAQGQLQGQGQAQGLINLNSTDVSNRISNDVRNTALNYAMSANANNSAAVSGGSQSGVDFSVVYPKQVAAIALGGLYPSAPCMGTSNVGGGNPFFNIAVGTSWESKECQVRETARSFAAIGLTQDAVAILCTSEYAAAAPSCPKPVAKE